ncbi:esterase [Candidatus Acidianus copahuensis]|uniref:Esterase n=1 Tax=Candidatus Acidianus copahuensis TaxID=1160895 RepID=A0A031LKE1_9CREN|nr:PaaI family thioesterase [Candidatus Acidianus copahuensis]EZQ01694.1 esterase [Candidatus Acidianus copahuensis]
MDDLARFVESLLKQEESIIKYLDFKVLEVNKGFARIEIPYKKELCRRGGVIHGGVIMTAMDITGGIATFSVNDGIDQVTQELKVNFLEPMYKGPFTVEGKVIRKGKTTVIVEITFKDVEGKIGAIGLGTWYIIKDKSIEANKG